MIVGERRYVEDLLICRMQDGGGGSFQSRGAVCYKARMENLRRVFSACPAPVYTTYHFTRLTRQHLYADDTQLYILFNSTLSNCVF